VSSVGPGGPDVPAGKPRPAALIDVLNQWESVKVLTLEPPGSRRPPGLWCGEAGRRPVGRVGGGMQVGAGAAPGAAPATQGAGGARAGG
jgi:hypothetical protein